MTSDRLASKANISIFAYDLLLNQRANTYRIEVVLVVVKNINTKNGWNNMEINRMSKGLIENKEKRKRKWGKFW